MEIRQKSICFLSPYIIPLLCNTVKNTGGAERQFALFGKYLHKQGWGVSYIVDENYMYMVDIAPFWCKLFPINISYMGGSKWNFIPGVISLIKAMLCSNADVFVVKTQAFLLLPMSFVCPFFGKKLVFWMQLDRDCRKSRKEIPWVLSWMQNLGMKFVNLFIAQSQNQADALYDNFNYHATVVPSIASFINTEVNQSCDNLDKKQPVVLWCGNSSRHKRQEVFFELARMMPDVAFMMAIGKADSLRYDQALMEAKNISNLKFLGSVSPQEMERWFAKAALYVNTSVIEGFPNTFLQAWQNGIPVVSLTVDPDDVLSKKQLGIVLKNKIDGIGQFDFKGLAAIIAPEVFRLVNDHGLRVDMGKRARRYVLQNHVESVVGPKLQSALFGLF